MKTDLNKERGPYNIWAETETSIEFNHCDPTGAVWHGKIFDFFEIGRNKLMERISYDYIRMKESGFMYPIVDINARYIKPIRFKERIKIKSVLLEYEFRLKIAYYIANIETGALSVKGISTQIAVDHKKMESCFACPNILTEKVEHLIKSGGC